MLLFDVVCCNVVVLIVMLFRNVRFDIIGFCWCGCWLVGLVCCGLGCLWCGGVFYYCVWIVVWGWWWCCIVWWWLVIFWCWCWGIEFCCYSLERDFWVLSLVISKDYRFWNWIWWWLVLEFWWFLFCSLFW